MNELRVGQIWTVAGCPPNIIIKIDQGNVYFTYGARPHHCGEINFRLWILKTSPKMTMRANTFDIWKELNERDTQ